MPPGPLSGVKILEFAGLGPAPFCGMLLSDMGGDVVRIDRKGARVPPAQDVLNRGRRHLGLDLKDAADHGRALDLIQHADVLIEGFRPGVMERLGLGPETALARNPRLIYGRMTGWGQTGPLAHTAGHDINYIALSGALGSLGRAGAPPSPPLNLVGDFGGGALYLAMGVCAALLEVSRSGRGQVIDCAMTDGAASLMAMMYGMRAAGWWIDERDANLLDGGAPFYDVYECADGRWIAVGAIEPQFYTALLNRTGLATDPAFNAQMDRSAWPALSERLAAIFRGKTRDEWIAVFEGTDACVAPVLSMGEAPAHPHNAARDVFVECEGVIQPNTAPRFTRTPGAVRASVATTTEDVLAAWRASGG
ncbi:MAG TPA: CaiB/BaiF CoA-transferase family protein [Caulobacterales bacterium]|nr:CaiB/BaiF CoA-transferase family protein [Caulobacterales bacterium]